MSIRSLIINPGSTSTKIGVFDDETQVFDRTLRHSTEEIAAFEHIVDQMSFRRDIILTALRENSIDVSSLNVVVGRGGLLKPIEGGTYAVTDKLAADLRAGVQGEHASNLGGLLAREIAETIGVPSYIVDPVVVDELAPVARISGVPEIERVSIFHALNAKAMARRYARETGVKYTDINVIVAHMGGGVSVSAHERGRVVDVFNALDGDGAFSPERAGGLPSGALVKLCFESGLTEQEVRRKIVGNGGFNAYLGTNDARDVDKMCEVGDEKAILVRDAFVYQLCKNIGAMAAVLGGRVDRIVLTGGIAHDSYVTAEIEKKVSFIAPITVYAGEDELLALAQGALRVMNGEEAAKEY
ncbi:butyrate kinase [Lachnoclostridium sp. Marseille-P6806]|uniref:butyrate kinase n=1 Tax=Lachnoclostridium sp. Marseille-P6806 TaxID=2364793 RepID=UPI001031A119|nr:butyrate kinase [Lachnoclostridium sp. Marseille-P6806]